MTKENCSGGSEGQAPANISISVITNTKKEASLMATNVVNPCEQPRLEIGEYLVDDAIPEKDKDRLRELQTELASETISKNRRKRLWKEVEWVANRKRRNDEKKVRASVCFKLSLLIKPDYTDLDEFKIKTLPPNGHIKS